MHPDILRQLADDHHKNLIAEAGQARRVREARSAQRLRAAAQLRRSTRPPMQDDPSRRGSRIPVTPAVDGQVEATR
jgi:hypothetical protein